MMLKLIVAWQPYDAQHNSIITWLCMSSRILQQNRIMSRAAQCEYNHREIFIITYDINIIRWNQRPSVNDYG